MGSCIGSKSVIEIGDKLANDSKINTVSKNTQKTLDTQCVTMQKTITKNQLHQQAVKEQKRQQLQIRIEQVEKKQSTHKKNSLQENFFEKSEPKHEQNLISQPIQIINVESILQEQEEQVQNIPIQQSQIQIIDQNPNKINIFQASRKDLLKQWIIPDENKFILWDFYSDLNLTEH